ncbi:hypothetical protein CHLRE_12g556300v5 [Chlamydomonas reinhardtii]|uniref:Cilia- and flagella-associated protein 300 n=1 Tax=Chlamydomonas reinhardtii TaxID=3055 RepID=CF300_CHLRE|nr:uncharacterized protein CHLRE_12g556300v5 [Chlamydomonas reinhardtii]A8IYS6.1 RecName: Full=Cilia- and flagella-associated protein 300; AltName: Full=Flagellar and basal body protein [Chlamydomonas reinhardtii]PNW75890.1 hypothetical protein CHLRE_12g556300v5 [Chlamydomonas reinhardtii]|eukprot:XP_001694050.1 flagellar/basal body protein [Chlamydomonas reinhardtii]
MTAFVPVSLPSTSALNDAYVKSQLTKWDLLRNLRCVAVRYTKYYHKLQGQELLADLFRDEKVQEAFQVLRKGGAWGQLGGPVTKVDATLLASSLTRMDLFDKLTETSPPIVRSNGDIGKCMEDNREGFQVSDQLRELILVEESEHAALFSEAERDELLWRLFEHVVLGGACCQFEDKVEPYVETSKRLYKELVCAQKDPATGKVQTVSAVYKINSIQGDSGPLELYPSRSRQNFCYAAVDPVRRIVKILYHAYVPYW